MSIARGVQGTRALCRNHVDKKDPGLQMTKADINRFLNEWEAKGCLTDTLEHYRSILERLYHVLPEDKRIHRDTLAKANITGCSKRPRPWVRSGPICWSRYWDPATSGSRSCQR